MIFIFEGSYKVAFQFSLKTQSVPFPMGASCIERQPGSYTWNFAVFSKEKLTHFVIQDSKRAEPPSFIPLIEEKNRSGSIWHIQIITSDFSLFWCWAVQKDQKYHVIQDPYAKLLDTKNKWGENKWEQIRNGIPLPLGMTYDWEKLYQEHVTHLEMSKAQKDTPLFIYEMHVRGFTQDQSSRVAFPGTFIGAIEKIPHLKKLGITAVELMPITEFDESEWPRQNPITNRPLYNYWGYSPLNFFAPNGRYFSSDDPQLWPNEFLAFVQTCHQHEIQVILDVVLNHTGEGNENGPNYSFKSLGKEVYYLLGSNEAYLNYSGCGNTINANHPIVSHMLIQSLQHWVMAYGVDGFRFDLASSLTRNQNGNPMNEPLFLEQLTHDPILSKTILIMEPWDAAGLYQTGYLYKLNQKQTPRFLEWNDKFRDDVRRFMRGEKKSAGRFATRMCGSHDLYSFPPQTSINYVTAHDGFSIQDLVSYNTKHNLENGEMNHDGAYENYSWNCGAEGVTTNNAILSLRIRQMQNYFVALFLAQGSPMMLMGDEYGHTKSGNNNTWCHDSRLNWFLWDNLHSPINMTSFINHLIGIRLSSGLFSQNSFIAPSDIEWHGIKPYTPDWSDESSLVAFSLLNSEGTPVLYIAFYTGHKNDISLEIPAPPQNKTWCVYVNTSMTRPQNFSLRKKAPKLGSYHIKMHPHSALVLGIC